MALAMVALALLTAEPTMNPVPCCTTSEELKAHDGQRVVVFGTYQATRIEMKKQPNKPPVHARVVTPAGPLVLGVYYQPEGRRPADELARLDGKKVRVVGTVHLRTPAQTSPTGIPMATMTEACLSPVESVALEP